MTLGFWTLNFQPLNSAVREPPVLQPIEVTRVLDRGRRLSYFGGSDYLRLSWHPAVRAGAALGAKRFGPTASASRMTTGNLPLFIELERELARFFGAQTATLTSAGYTAALVAAQALAPDHSHVVLDERAHLCLLDGAQLTGLPVARFRHLDPDDLARAVRACGRKARLLVMTDGLFSHSGAAAPLAAYQATLPASATLLVDDAHGAGVLGRRGRGTPEWSGVGLEGMVVTITLSKAFGCYGGVVLGSRQVRRDIFDRSRIFVGNTAVALPAAAGTLAALDVLRREGMERRARLHAHARFVKEGIRTETVEVPGPMFSLAPPDAASAARLSRMLLAAEIYPSFIRYPNGPADRFFRFAVSSEHTPAQLAALRDVLHEFHHRCA
jgi:8-amino-7-oxononanoate synthase